LSSQQVNRIEDPFATFVALLIRVLFNVGSERRQVSDRRRGQTILNAVALLFARFASRGKPRCDLFKADDLCAGIQLGQPRLDFSELPFFGFDIGGNGLG
jgi:hypothetical protein